MHWDSQTAASCEMNGSSDESISKFLLFACGQ